MRAFTGFLREAQKKCACDCLSGDAVVDLRACAKEISEGSIRFSLRSERVRFRHHVTEHEYAHLELTTSSLIKIVFFNTDEVLVVLIEVANWTSFDIVVAHHELVVDDPLEVFVIVEVNSFLIQLLLVDVGEHESRTQTQCAISESRESIVDAVRRDVGCLHGGQSDLVGVGRQEVERFDFAVHLVEPLAQLVNVRSRLSIDLLLERVEPAINYRLIFDLFGAQVFNHVVKNALDIISCLSSISLSLSYLLGLRRILELLPSCFLLGKPSLDDRRIVSVTDDGVAESILDFRPEGIPVVAHVVVRNIVAIFIPVAAKQVAAVLSIGPVLLNDFIGMVCTFLVVVPATLQLNVTWITECVQINIDIVGMGSVLSKELANLRE